MTGAELLAQIPPSLRDVPHKDLCRETPTPREAAAWYDGCIAGRQPHCPKCLRVLQGLAEGMVA